MVMCNGRRNEGKRGWRAAVAVLAAAALAGPAVAQDEEAADARGAEGPQTPSVTPQDPGPEALEGELEARIEARVERRAELGSGAELELALAGGRPWQTALVLVARAGEEPALRDRPSFTVPVTLDGTGAARIGLGDALVWENASALVVWSGSGGRVRGSTRVELNPSVAGPTGFQRGSVLVTEFMKDPSFVSDTSGEWIEFHNPGPGRVNLEGMTLSDNGSNSHTISNSGFGLFVRPGKYLVIGNNTDVTTNGGVPVRYGYSGFTLANGADAIVLTHPSGQVMDRVDYDDGVLWPDSAGMSISLSPGMENAIANDDPLNWCHSVTLIGGANPDTGTPRLPNDVCP